MLNSCCKKIAVHYNANPSLKDDCQKQSVKVGNLFFDFAVSGLLALIFSRMAP
jgi:hypothetical protein